MPTSSTLLTVIALVILIVVAWRYLNPRPRRSDDLPLSEFHEGCLDDLDRHLAQLMSPSTHWETLVVEIVGTEDFFQYSTDKTVLQLDLPLVTERQKELQPLAETVLRDLGQEPYITKASLGDGFLDCDLKGTRRDHTAVSMAFAKRVFAISEETPVTFNLM